MGTSASYQSRVWFTISHGILNEVYYPRIDQANTRDMEFLVADGDQYFSEEKRDTNRRIAPLEQGVPGYRLVNSCKRGRYRMTKVVITDPERDVLLQKIHFDVGKGKLEDYGVYALLAPHIGNRGYGNNGWIGNYKGIPMLFAQREGVSLALASSTPFKRMSCGYVGVSDGWQDVNANKKMAWEYSTASNGNVALTAELDLMSNDGECVTALAFGRSPDEAEQQARSALMKDFDKVQQEFVGGWKEIQSQSMDLGKMYETGFDLYRVSNTVLRTHEEKSYPGAVIASLSIPWGFSKGDNDLGGYHLIWPRDLAQAAGGFIASGDTEHAIETLLYLMSTQEEDGHWLQNMWLDGSPYWGGVQMDETAFPILVADQLKRLGALSGFDASPMIRRAAGYLVRNGPVTQQDRWEEDGGYSPFTLAAEIAGLLAAAEFAEENGDYGPASYLRETADNWNEAIERWTYVTGTKLANRVGVDGYYVRIAPANPTDIELPASAFVSLRNRPLGHDVVLGEQLVSVDAFALVRYGLRSAKDPRILNTVKVIDSILRKETKTGPVWHRYNMDGYGEHDDGSPFDGTGVGRGWPLLAGERAHYEIAKGDVEEAERLLHVIEAQASSGGLIPEQVWDSEDIPKRGLHNGRPAGSAMPLVWAHAEYIKLARSIRERKIFDMPPQPVIRYQNKKTSSKLAAWRFNQKIRTIPAGRNLRIEALTPAVIHWSGDNWKTVTDSKTVDTGFGIYYADLETSDFLPGGSLVFTFFWPESNKWEGTNFQVTIVERQLATVQPES
ncbi:MAG TPA: glucan 1,4-alpha-glucosidase [Candidatus Angelobacter sp.]|nr:glucan 1,4-alpha-glucosidase [Candidatus Angelobacter sp.]